MCSVDNFETLTVIWTSYAFDYANETRQDPMFAEYTPSSSQKSHILLTSCEKDNRTEDLWTAFAHNADYTCLCYIIGEKHTRTMTVRRCGNMFNPHWYGLVTAIAAQGQWRDAILIGDFHNGACQVDNGSLFLQ